MTSVLIFECNFFLMKRKEVNEETKQNRQLRRLKPKSCDGSCGDCFCTGYGLGSNTQRPFEDIYNSADCDSALRVITTSAKFKSFSV